MIRKTFKKYLSPRVEEPKSEVNNKMFVHEQRNPPAFVSVFVYVYTTSVQCGDLNWYKSRGQRYAGKAWKRGQIKWERKFALYKQGLNKIMETPGSFKRIYFIWFCDCRSPVKSGSFPLTVFELTRFSRWSLSSAVLFGAVFLWSFLTISVWQSLSNSFRFLPEFCFSEKGFPSFSNAVITFETVLLATSNNSTVFVTLAPAIRAPTTWSLLKFDRFAILINFDLFLLMLYVKKQTISVK